MNILSEYSFSPGEAGAGTITISGALTLESFGIITNVTRGSVLYSPTEGQAGASVSQEEGETILTLEQNTTYCEPTDKLQIIVYDTVGSSGGGPEELLSEISEDTGSIDGKLPELDDGRIPVNIGGATVNITGDVTVSNEVEIKNTVDDPVPTSVPIRTPTTTSVASSATSVAILASNANRKGFSISNISTSKLYLSFTDAATTANCFIELPAGAFLLLDQQLIVSNAIYGIWASANGTAQVTEYV